MMLHPRAQIVRQAKAEFAVELMRSRALAPLTYVERTMVLSAVLGHEMSDYILADLRIERHGCHHIKADQHHEGVCQECEAEND